MSFIPLLRMAYVMAIRRIASSWRLQIAVALGMVLAVALLSSGVIYSSVLQEASLRHTLRRGTPEDVNLSIGVFNPLDRKIYNVSQDFVEERVYRPLQPYLRERAHLVEVSTFFFKGRPHLEQPEKGRPRGRLQYMSGLQNRVRVVQGRLPMDREVGAVQESPRLEVAIDVLGSEVLGLSVGDEMEVFPAAGAKDPPSVTVRIVGIIERLNTMDEFWYGTRDSFSYVREEWAWTPMFSTEPAIFEQLGRVYPGIHTDVTWFFFLDRERIRASQVKPLQTTISRVVHDVRANLARSSAFTKLERVLDQYNQQLLLARVPLFLLVFLVTGILMYYLFLVAGLIARARAPELALLRSRGATTPQVALLMFVEGLVLAVPAIVLGPFVALAVALALSRVFSPTAVELSVVPVALSPMAFLLGALGGLLAVAMLTLSSLGVSRQGIVEFRQMGARPPSTPFIHRYYLDFLLLALIGLLWWQLRERGSFVVRTLSEDALQIDFSMILGPALGLAALGLLFLRFFPLGVGVLARALEPLGPAWLAQGLRRISRDPISPGALIVLLMLATSLGVMGAAFSSTLERSQREQILYAAGADLRVEYNPTGRAVSSEELEAELTSLPGVAGVSGVVRQGGSLMTSGFGTSMTLLAADTDSFANVAWYRPDFASRPLKEILGTIRSNSMSDGIQLPGHSVALGLWVHPSRPYSSASLLARLRDAQGFYFDMMLGGLNFKGWQYLQAPIQPLSVPGRRPPVTFSQVVPPVTLLALHIVDTRSLREPGALFLDELKAITPDGEVVLSDFVGAYSNTPLAWYPLDDPAMPGLYALEPSDAVIRPNRRSAAFTWAPGGLGARGIRAGLPEKPLPALVSRSLLETADARVGDNLVVRLTGVGVPLKVVAVADYFPTLYPKKEPFAVVDRDGLLHYLNLHSPRLAQSSGELWLRFAASPPTPEAVAGILESKGFRTHATHHGPAMVASRLANPLVTATWGGLLALAFLTVVLASASSVMLFLYLDTRERQTELALLLTMGLSRRQLNGVIWLNLFTIVLAGIGLGIWAGQRLGAALLPLLEVAEEGSRLVPPMVLQTNWTVLGWASLILAVAAAAAVAWLAWILSRLEVQEVLRTGEV